MSEAEVLRDRRDYREHRGEPVEERSGRPEVADEVAGQAGGEEQGREREENGRWVARRGECGHLGSYLETPGAADVGPMSVCACVSMPKASGSSTRLCPYS